MLFYSDKNPLFKFSLKDAVLGIHPRDGGLSMPFVFPFVSEKYISTFRNLSLSEIALRAIAPWVFDDIKTTDLESVVESAFNFDIPLRQVSENLFSLELFHGPTHAFKDVGARFMAEVVSYFTIQDKKSYTVLVATSGDTGGAVASAFYGKENINVVLLYPSQRISPLQEKQLTTFGGNVRAVEIQGSFDDCQKLAKMAFNDRLLTERLKLLSANSINISRLIAQSVYYFLAYVRAPEGSDIYVSVPSGNFGNLTAGLFAKKIGLPIKKFIASTNINDEVTLYLKGKPFIPRPSVETISNAMDVGNPSNFSRILALYDSNFYSIINDIWGTAVTDDDTRRTIIETYSRYNYLLDPHGAVAMEGITRYFKEHGEKGVGIVLETAHPAKFKEIIDEILPGSVDFPEDMIKLLSLKKSAEIIPNDYECLKDLLLSM